MNDSRTSSADTEGTTTALALVRDSGRPMPSAVSDRARLGRRCERLAQDVGSLSGPGSAAVRAAARQLVLALELYEQQQRRLGAEVLRSPSE